MKEDAEGEGDAKAEPAHSVIVNENETAGEVCDVEVRDYKKINVCGCKFWGITCQSYISFVEVD